MSLINPDGVSTYWTEAESCTWNLRLLSGKQSYIPIVEPIDTIFGFGLVIRIVLEHPIVHQSDYSCFAFISSSFLILNR